MLMMNHLSIGLLDFETLKGPQNIILFNILVCKYK